MNFSKSAIAIIISSLLSINIPNAIANSNQIDSPILNSSQEKNSTDINELLTRGHFETRLRSKSFNWNHAQIKNIVLNKNLATKNQYRNALDSYFVQVAETHGANKMSLFDSTMSKLHDTGRGGLIAHYQQKIQGVEVFGRFINVLINRENKYIASSGYFASTRKMPSSYYLLSPPQALAQAFYENTGTQIEIKKSVLSPANSDFSRLTSNQTNNLISMTKNSRVKKVFFPMTNGQIIPAYYVEAETTEKGSRSSKWFSYVIDGQSGKILFKNNLTSHVVTTYKVFADSGADNIPFDGPQGNALTPHPTGILADTPAIGGPVVSENTVTLDHAGLSTQDPWLSNSQTTTSGNNVDAYADISGADGFDATDVRPATTGPNAFEYDFGAFADGLSGDPQKHAVVSLFYVNNFLHDWFYDNGFDEAAGNAQVSNFNRGGSGGDPILAEAQDSSGTNNANMSTPQDGGSPRMQMFLWNLLSDARIEVDGISNIETLAAAFGPTDFDVTAVLSLVNDGTEPFGDGCETIATDLSGLIAIIDRGDCNFTVKVKNAQDAGALGVIMANNVAGGVITQGGEDATVTIPSMMASLDKGDEIKAALAVNANLQARLFNQAQPLDGTLDNGIVAHEWAHYLSNRLVGNANGLSNNQGQSMGEGWSDFVALLMSVRESDNLIAGNENFQGVYSASTFIGDAYDGIRRAPYSTDMTKNALTFKHIEDGVSLPLSHPVSFGVSGANNSEVHATGEIWANVMWESYVGLINKPGNSFAQAQQSMKDYLIAGLKLTPNAPTILEARDALLAAAVANNADDFAIIRDAFAKRGMGALAIAPDRSSASHSGVVEDFTAGVDLQFSLQLNPASLDNNTCDNDGVLDAGESASFSVSVKSAAAASIPGFNLSLSSGDDLTFASNSVAIDGIAGFGQATTATFEVTLNSASDMQNIEVTASIPEIGAGVDDFFEPPPISINLLTHFDFAVSEFDDDMSVESTSLNDWDVSFDNNITSFLVENESWHGVDSGSPGNSYLLTPIIRAADSGELTINFDHYYFFESSEDDQGVLQNWDAGVIEVSVNGAAFVDVVNFGASLSEPYNGTVNSFNDQLGGQQAYTFTRDENDLQPSGNAITFPDGLVNGQNIQVRFRIGTDANTADFGWLIDNLVVNNATSPMFSSVVAENNSCGVGNTPVVNAGADILVISSDQSDIDISLNGSATDADGDSLTLQWTQLSGPQVTLNNSNNEIAGFSVARPSSDIQMTFDLAANDGTTTISDTVLVEIRLNQAPTVTAIGGVVQEQQQFTLNAVASDNENDPITFNWTQTAGPNVVLSDSSSSSPNFTSPSVDSNTTLVFEVIVNDGNLDSVAASAEVTVQPVFVDEGSDSGGGGGSLATYWLTVMLIFQRFFRSKKSTKKL